MTDGVRAVDHPSRSALPGIAGALRRSLLRERASSRPLFGPEAPGSIRRRRRPGFHQPPGLSADVRRVLVPFTARIRISGADGGRARAGRQAPVERPTARTPCVRRDRRARTRHTGRPAAPDSAGTGHRWTIARRGGRPCRASCGCGASGGTRHTGPAPDRSRGRASPDGGDSATTTGVAERVGFEPTKSFDSALFKSAAINHSATSPGRQG